MKLIDLTGNKYGFLTVTERIKIKGNKKTHWKCLCDCGKECIISGSNLVSGNTKSCGCKHYDLVSKTLKSKNRNKYDLSGSYGIGYTYDGVEFYFDLEDYEKIKKYKWRVVNEGYIGTVERNKNGKHLLFLHKAIMNVPKGYMVDHIKGRDSRRDNRKNNLRIVNRNQNRMNTPIQKNNTSGVTGVYLDKKCKKWTARIGINGKNILLGTFDHFEEAVNARQRAEDKYYGEYSYKSSQKIPL